MYRTLACDHGSSAPWTPHRAPLKYPSRVRPPGAQRGVSHTGPPSHAPTRRGGRTSFDRTLACDRSTGGRYAPLTLHRPLELFGPEMYHQVSLRPNIFPTRCFLCEHPEPPAGPGPHTLPFSKRGPVRVIARLNYRLLRLKSMSLLKIRFCYRMPTKGLM